jgi:hypothetical protein
MGTIVIKVVLFASQQTHFSKIPLFQHPMVFDYSKPAYHRLVGMARLLMLR